MISALDNANVLCRTDVDFIFWAENAIETKTLNASALDTKALKILALFRFPIYPFI